VTEQMRREPFPIASILRDAPPERRCCHAPNRTPDPPGVVNDGAGQGRTHPEAVTSIGGDKAGGDVEEQGVAALSGHDEIDLFAIDQFLPCCRKDAVETVQRWLHAVFKSLERAVVGVDAITRESVQLKSPQIGNLRCEADLIAALATRREIERFGVYSQVCERGADDGGIDAA